MRIVDRATFLRMPAGTIYSFTKPAYVDGFMLKDETWWYDIGPDSPHDWLYLDLVGNFNHDDFAGNSDGYFAMDEQGVSLPFDEAGYGRDGMYDRAQRFLIYDADDLRKIRTIIDGAIAVAEQGGR